MSIISYENSLSAILNSGSETCRMYYINVNNKLGSIDFVLFRYAV